MLGTTEKERMVFWKGKLESAFERRVRGLGNFDVGGIGVRRHGGARATRRVEGRENFGIGNAGVQGWCC